MVVIYRLPGYLFMCARSWIKYCRSFVWGILQHDGGSISFLGLIYVLGLGESVQTISISPLPPGDGISSIVMALVPLLRDLLHVEGCSMIASDANFGFAFSSNLSRCPILDAELWAILYGVRFAWARGFHNLLIESDSQLAIGLIKNGCSQSHPSYALVHASNRCFPAGEQLYQVVPCPSRSKPSRWCQFFVSVPPFIVLALVADSANIHFPRGF